MEKTISWQKKNHRRDCNTFISSANCNRLLTFIYLCLIKTRKQGEFFYFQHGFVKKSSSLYERNYQSAFCYLKNAVKTTFIKTWKIMKSIFYRKKLRSGTCKKKRCHIAEQKTRRITNGKLKNREIANHRICVVQCPLTSFFRIENFLSKNARQRKPTEASAATAVARRRC